MFWNSEWRSRFVSENYWRGGWRSKFSDFLHRFGNALAVFNNESELFDKLNTLETENKQLWGLLDIERLASLIHDEWISWSKTLASKGEVTSEKEKAWEKYWVPYDQLNEEVKDMDREWAYKVATLRNDPIVTIQVPINSGWTIEQQGTHIKAEYYDPEEEECPKAKNG